MRKILLATAAALALSGAAKADSIVINVSVDGVLINSVTSPGGTFSFVNQAFGVFNLNTVTITTQSALAQPGVLSTNSLDVAQTATGNHTLKLDIMATGVTGPGALEPVDSSFSTTGLSNGWTATEQTHLDGLLLANVTFSATGGFSATALQNVPTSYTAEAVYIINSSGSGQFNGGINMAAASPSPVPGPIVGAGLPGLISACFGMVGLARFRRRRAA
jgi:hypothetical protein